MQFSAPTFAEKGKDLKERFCHNKLVKCKVKKVKLVMYIPGTEWSESLTGTEGNDEIVGFGGNDTLDGRGNTLYRSQQDILNGGTGADTFVLGAGATVYYLDDFYTRDSYALIEDYYNSDRDLIQLGGIESGYNFADIGGGVEISYYGDLIAFVAGVSSNELVFNVV